MALAVLVLSYWTAGQVVTPQHRMIKLAVLAAVLMFMFRLDMLFSVFLFTLLFPFPSGISVGSTNSILMTLIALTWAIRASSTGQPIHQRTPYDRAIIFLLIAYVLSFWHVQSDVALRNGLNMVFKQIASILYFYFILRFANDEQRLMRFTRVVCVMVSLVALTGVVELFDPGASIIPGWVVLKQPRGVGEFAHRVQGVRLGGAVHGHNILGDICMLGLFLLGFNLVKTKNPLARLLWIAGGACALISLLATANRGALVSLLVGLLYTVFVFRRRVALPKLITIGASVTVLMAVTEAFLIKFTPAANVFQRLLGTEFTGIEPDTRHGIWQHAFFRGLETPILGHGPWYDTGYGLTAQYWPHNAYLFYFYTIGLLGLAGFLWVCYLLIRASLVFKDPSVRNTDIGDLVSLMHVEMCTLMIAIIRTDHQRDEIHMHVIWLIFGLVAASAAVARRRVAESRSDE